MQLDYRILGFAMAVATACGIGFGLTPALQATRVDVAGALREEKGSSGSSLSLTRSWFTLKNALVTGQVAASFLLLAGAVVATSVLAATQSRSVGYRPEGLAILELDPNCIQAIPNRPSKPAIDRAVKRLFGAMPPDFLSALPDDGLQPIFRPDARLMLNRNAHWERLNTNANALVRARRADSRESHSAQASAAGRAGWSRLPDRHRVGTTGSNSHWAFSTSFPCWWRLPL